MKTSRSIKLMMKSKTDKMNVKLIIISPNSAILGFYTTDEIRRISPFIARERL